MAVLKNKTQGNFTIVSQNIMRDNNLSLTERGMLLTLLSLPDNWHLTIAGLCQILPDGKDKIAKTLNNLIDKGYVTREQSRSDGGQFDATNLEVHECPISIEKTGEYSGNSLESSSNTGVSPCPENPDTVNPDTEKPHTENPSQYINNIYINKIDNIHKVCTADTLPEAEYDYLVSKYGKLNVDYHIKRIKDNGYKNCLNRDTIESWCKERLNRTPTGPNNPTKKNSFLNFPQRKYNFEELEKDAICI